MRRQLPFLPGPLNLNKPSALYPRDISLLQLPWYDTQFRSTPGNRLGDISPEMLSAGRCCLHPRSELPFAGRENRTESLHLNITLHVLLLPRQGMKKSVRSDARKMGALKVAHLNGLSMSRHPVQSDAKDEPERDSNDERVRMNLNTL